MGTEGNEGLDLERFVRAQNHDATYDRALFEIRSGLKQSHWMWFVFPQIAGLGRSPTAREYAIGSLEEAVAFLDHPVLGPRLVESTRALNDLPDHDADRVLGSTDAVKLRSSMTLFAEASKDEEPFEENLLAYFHGHPDRRTLEILDGGRR